MNATQHTPGPWIIDGGSWTPRTQHLIRAKAVYCDAWIPVAHCYEPEAAANVRLIAAAPDLLAALQRLASIADEGAVLRHETGKPTWSFIDEVKQSARAAIAKATGGTQ